MYEGVDERQIALALKYVKEQAEQNDFQYLVLLNSDNLPAEDLSRFGFNWRPYIRRVLHDRDPAATLLGFRF
ncbi:DUF2326 domain-containing protein [Nonomuraea sp. CA-218870]|uniref:DUF2326 domain-containing protein n=1 Tax=Nonomuraea sp. CA-218870 TaxID=3239998 RepID=UPI003D939AB9